MKIGKNDAETLRLNGRGDEDCSTDMERLGQRGVPRPPAPGGRVMADFKEAYAEMVRYFQGLGFTSVVYRTGGTEFTEVWCTPEGMYVEIDPARKEFTLSTVDGLILCTTQAIGFPNPHTEVFIKKLRRHVTGSTSW